MRINGINAVRFATQMSGLLLAIMLLPAQAGEKNHPTTTSITCASGIATIYAPISCTVTVTDSGGQASDRSPVGTVTLSSDSSGTFSTTSCTLTATTTVSSACNFTYTPTAEDSGTHRITGNYAGGFDPSPPGVTFSGSSGFIDLSMEYPAPTINSITPAFGAFGTTFSVTVAGSGFVPGVTTLSIGGSGVTVSGVSIDSSTQLTATLTIAPTAATGFRDVTVANPAPGGGSATLINGFEVQYPVPVINNLTPSAVEKDSGAVTVTINGSNFVSDSVAWFNGSARPTVFINSSQVTMDLSAADTSVLGDYNVNIVNPTPGGGTSNTATFSVVVAGGSFESVEESAALGSAMYTKIAGAAFNVDLLATDVGRSTINTGFSGSVKVELLDATDDSGALDAAGCRSSWGVVQALADQTYSAGDNGRITLAVTQPSAVRVARFRVSYPSAGAPTHVGCSSDAFSIRPGTFSLSSALNQAGTSGTPVHPAGTNFTLTATALPGYDGTPQIETAALNYGGSVDGTLAGTFPAATSATGVSSGTNFSYDEVGNIVFGAEDVYDESFTAIDQPDDCTDDFSNALVGGKYGCKIGNNAALTVGRFVPAYFGVTLTQHGCDAQGFTYSKQPFLITVTAREAGGTVTENYDDGSYAKDVALSDEGDTTNLSPVAISGLDFGDGIVAGMPLVFTFASPTTPFETIAIRAEDTDGVTSLGHLEGSTQVRSSRLVIEDATAITTMNGMAEIALQSWQETAPGFYEWAVHADDAGCTGLLQTDFALVFNDPNITAADTSISGFFFNSGQGALTLSAPGTGKDGTVDITVDISGRDWLEYWNGTAFEVPTGSIQFFEIFQSEPGFIERHEVIP